MSNAQHSSGSAEWYTPLEWVARVRATLTNIELDPASSEAANEVICAEHYFTEEASGLDQSWSGMTIFCNPPGRCGPTQGGCGAKTCRCKLPRRFWNKLVETQVRDSRVSAIYLAYSLEQLLWLDTSVSAAIAIPHKRIKFTGAGSSPTHGNAFVLLTSDSDVLTRFKEQFGPYCNLLCAVKS